MVSHEDLAVPQYGPRPPINVRGPFGRFVSSAGRFVFEVAKVVLVALAIIVPVRIFLFQPFQVNGGSMDPNFQDRDYLVIDEVSYRFREPERGEVIVFRFPRDPSQFFIKRIIGMPGETVRIQDGSVYVLVNGVAQKLDESQYLDVHIATSGTNQEIVLGQEQYFMLGDNRAASSDSRAWGPIQRDDIIGRAWWRAWPFARAENIDTPQYNLQSPERAPV
jgi:signal peptidase I